MTLQPGTYGILEVGRTLREIRTFVAPFEAKDGRVLPVVMTAQPAFNAATHKVVQNGWSVNQNDVTPVWQVVALSQAELDEATEQTQIAAILATANDMINGVGTTAQRQQRVEVALGRLLKRLAKNGTIP